MYSASIYAATYIFLQFLKSNNTDEKTHSVRLLQTDHDYSNLKTRRIINLRTNHSNEIDVNDGNEIELANTFKRRGFRAD